MALRRCRFIRSLVLTNLRVGQIDGENRAEGVRLALAKPRMGGTREPQNRIGTGLRSGNCESPALPEDSRSDGRAVVGGEAAISLQSFNADYWVFPRP